MVFVGRAAFVAWSGGAVLGGISCSSSETAAPSRAGTPVAASTVIGGYQLTIIQGEEWLAAASINNFGRIAGTRGQCTATCRPFVWTATSGVRILSGTPVGSTALDNNGNGQVLVRIYESGLDRDVIWHSSGIRRLPGLDGDFTNAYALNRWGDATGNAVRFGAVNHPVFWPASGGVVEIVPATWHGGGIARGLNSTGRVVGTVVTTATTPLAGFPSDCRSCGFMWDRDGGLRRIPIQSKLYTATAINDQGHVVGWLRITGGTSPAYRWHPVSGLRVLGTLGGNFAEPTAINNLGVVVGNSRDAGGVSRPFVWDKVHGMVALGLPEGAIAGNALDININGVIVGYVVFPGPHSAMAIWSPL
jgi:probable HAF family extracellular repeat protein